jgi:hypothetical protein
VNLLVATRRCDEREETLLRATGQGSAGNAGGALMQSQMVNSALGELTVRKPMARRECDARRVVVENRHARRCVGVVDV